MGRTLRALTFIALGWIASLNPTVAGGSPRGARGERDLSDGQIKSVTCYGRRLRMRLQTRHELLELYTNNYFQVDFSAANFKPKHTLNPCKEIQGMRAQAIFYDVPGHPNEGILISVELKKTRNRLRK